MRLPLPGGIGFKYTTIVNGTRPGNGKERYFAFNLLEEIDFPGEWSYHFRTSTLLLWPPASRDDKSDAVLLAKLPRPVSFMNEVSHVTLQGLDVEGGLKDAIVVDGGSHVTVASCHIHNTVTGGVNIEGGSQHTVQSSDLDHLGSFGIRLSASDRKALEPANLIAGNNHICDYGEQERVMQGIYLRGHRQSCNA